MSISKLQICNVALGKLGVKPITSLTENSQAARYCNVFYDMSKNYVLRDFPWNFANKTEIIAAISVPEGWDKWSYAFGYPVDCLLARKLHDGTGVESAFEVIVYENAESLKLKAILSDVEVSYLNYTALIGNTTLFDTQFVELLALYLAQELAWPILKNSSMGTTLYGKYQVALGRTKTSDASEQNYLSEPDTLWATDRLN